MKNTNTNNSNRPVVTGIVRFSYCHVFEPKAVQGDEVSKYSICIMIPKSDTMTVTKIKTAIQNAYENGQATLKGNGRSVPAFSVIRNPLRDGDTERPDDPAFAGCYFLNATSRFKPGIVDQDLNSIIDRMEFYSGCYGRASLGFYAYSFNGNRGIACGLNNLQKLKDGEPMGGRTTAAMDFGDADDDSDDAVADFLN